MNGVIERNLRDTLQTGELIAKGSESYVYSGVFLGLKVIVKDRMPKKYRHPILDQKIRTDRMKLEIRILNTALNASIPVPAILGVDPVNNRTIMEYIEGKLIGDLLKTLGNKLDETIELLFVQIGRLTGKMHTLKIVHGDLTIYNLIVKEGKIFVIDFGLSRISDDIEDFATDLETFESALRTFNPQITEHLFNAFLKGYKTFDNSEKVLRQYYEILSRGRYKIHK